VNLSITWLSLSPQKSSTWSSPSSFSKCIDINFWFVIKTIAKFVANGVWNLILEQKLDLWDKLSTPPISHWMVMCTKMDCCLSLIALFVNNVIHACNTCVNKKRRGGTNFVKWQTKIICLKWRTMSLVQMISLLQPLKIKYSHLSLQHYKWSKHWTLQKAKLKSFLLINNEITNLLVVILNNNFINKKNINELIIITYTWINKLTY